MNQQFQIPEGYCLRKIGGGRPNKDARNIAVWLAKLCRTERHGELAKQADAWILDAWKSTSGISEEAHIRRAVRSAQAVLNKNILNVSDKFVIAVQSPIKNGAPCWLWCEGTTEAVPLSVSNTVTEFQQQTMNMSQTAIAVRRLFSA